LTQTERSAGQTAGRRPPHRACRTTARPPAMSGLSPQTRCTTNRASERARPADGGAGLARAPV